MGEMTIIYVPLLDEGTSVWRPVSAERLSKDTFRIAGPMPDDEQWAFTPDSIVTVAHRHFADGNSGLVAQAKAG
jgi:hypothetical protein